MFELTPLNLTIFVLKLSRRNAIGQTNGIYIDFLKRTTNATIYIIRMLAYRSIFRISYIDFITTGHQTIPNNKLIHSQQF